MAQFEPPSDAIEDYDSMKFALQNSYADEDLLLELRRRGRLGRIEAHDAMPVRFCTDVPIELQIGRAWMVAAREVASAHVKGRVPPGCKVETKSHLPGVSFPHDGERVVTVVLNYVIGG